MPDDSPQPTDEISPQPSGNFVDKAKEFFTMGGDKKKWRKALIISAIIILIMALGIIAGWGTALAYWIRSIAEPNGNPADGNYGIIKTMEVNVTMYSPVIGTNTCDGPISMGGGETTSDGSGKFVFQNGKIQWVRNGEILDHIFAEPSDNPIIPWDKIDSEAVQIPGFLNDTPIEIHDHYAPGKHKGENFLDLSYTCGEGAELSAQLKAVQKQQGLTGGKEGGILIRVNIVGPGTGTSPSLGPGVIYQPNAYTAAQIDSYLKSQSPKSPLNGKGATFVASGQKYGVNPGFLLGITNAESSLGMQTISGSPPAPKGLGGSNNAFGLTRGGQGHFIIFPRFEDGIDLAAKNVAAPPYKHLDGTLREFRLKWCGFETESEKSGIKLSDGTIIDYSCDNGASDWIKEVTAVMTAIK